MLCGNLDGRVLGGEWIHVYVRLNPFSIQLKLSQHCLLISYIPVQNKKLKCKKKKKKILWGTYHQPPSNCLLASHIPQVSLKIIYMKFMRALLPKTDGSSSFKITYFFSLDGAIILCIAVLPAQFLWQQLSQIFFCPSIVLMALLVTKENHQIKPYIKGFVNGKSFVNGDSQKRAMMLHQPRQQIALSCFCLDVIKPHTHSLSPAQ